jgi:DNA-binding transcriptional LysR family regulator
LEFAGLRAFLAVLDAGAFKAAAVETGISRTRLAREVSRLEERVGQALLERTATGVVATPAGLSFEIQARELLALHEDTLEFARRGDRPRSSLELRVSSVHRLFAAEQVLPLVARHNEPRQSVLVVDPQPEAAPGRLVLAPGDGTSEGPWSAQRAGVVSRSLAASSTYLAGRAPPRTLADLAGHQVVGLPGASWPLWGGGEAAVEPTVVVNSPVEVVAAVRGGAGVGLVDDDRGLVVCLEGEVGDEVTLWLIGDPAELPPEAAS